MCGIAGIMEGSYPARVEPDETVRLLIQGIAHRGPDDQGYASLRPAHLGMCRLSIIDQAGGRQPIHNEDQSLTTVFNGEIYNYIELRKTLETQGHQFQTRSDTETLVHLYEQYGDDLVHHLRGMFAFALWDHHRQRLLIARDPLGKKPLFYHRADDGTLSFCSELHPLARLPGMDRSLNPEALGGYLHRGYIQTPHTIYRHIHSLPPAHLMIWQNGTLTMRSYTRLHSASRFTGTRVEALEKTAALIDESLKLRLRSDVPLAILLSGGLDSNIILQRCAKVGAFGVTAYTVGFDDPNYDESGQAARAAERIGVPHQIIRGTPELLEELPHLIRHYGQPFADKSALPTLALCRAVARHEKVALVGDGGDEAFAGYSRYVAAHHKRNLSQAMTKWPDLRRHLSAAALKGSPLVASWVNRRLGRHMLPELESLVSREFFSGRHWLHVATADLQNQMNHSLNERVDAFWHGEHDPVDRMLQWDVHDYLPDDLLVKMDIASMAHGLEVRAPFLDVALVRWCASLPSEWKFGAGGGKQILRDLYAESLGTEVLSTPKRGFSVPLKDWWRGEPGLKVRDGFLNWHPALAPHIPSQVPIYYLNAHRAGRANHAQRIWCLHVLNTWAHENPL
ncbi:MAG: asparagine synthase (glutamine-hydrolyzing) [Candidatus Methylacidiphilales bacterium]